MPEIKKRIIIYSTAYLPLVGGAEIAIKEIADRLPEREFDLITARLKSGLPPVERIGATTIYRVGWGGPIDKFLLPILGTWRGWRLHRANPYQAIWAMMASQSSIAAVFLRLLTGVPLILTLQEGDEEEYLKRYVGGNNLLYKILIRPWHTLVIRRADRLTSISQYLLKRARGGGARAPIDIVPNGVNIANFSRTFPESELQTLRDRYRLKPEERVIVTASRLVTKNAVDDLIRSIPHFKTPIRLLILGDGPDRESLKALAEKLQVGGRVVFVGNVGHDEMPKYFRIAAVFIRPSLSEGFGNVFVEAMAAELPVIATPVGGIVDFLFDPEANTGVEPTGLFVPVRDPGAIARQVERLIGDPALKARIVANGRALVTEKYDWAIIASAMAASLDRAGE